MEVGDFGSWFFFTDLKERGACYVAEFYNQNFQRLVNGIIVVTTERTNEMSTIFFGSFLNKLTKVKSVATIPKPTNLEFSKVDLSE